MGMWSMATSHTLPWASLHTHQKLFECFFCIHGYMFCKHFYSHEYKTSTSNEVEV